MTDTPLRSPQTRHAPNTKPNTHNGHNGYNGHTGHSSQLLARELDAGKTHCAHCREPACRRPHARRPVNPTVSVVIAAKNEEDNVGWVAARLRDVDEIILVDGNSTDNTIAAWKSVHAHVTVIGQQHPGKGAAVAAGLMAATGDIVIMLDADGSMDPLEIPALVGALKAGADVVKGSRRAPGGGSNDLSIVRKTGNRALTILANTLYRQRWSELNYGMAGFWRDTLRQLGVEELVDGTDAPQTGPVSSRLLAGAQKGRTRQQLRYGHGFEIEAVLFCRAARQGLRVTETASFEYDRRYGHSNLDTWRDGLRVLAAIAHERAVATRKHHP